MPRGLQQEESVWSWPPAARPRWGQADEGWLCAVAVAGGGAGGGPRGQRAQPTGGVAKHHIVEYVRGSGVWQSFSQLDVRDTQTSLF